MMPRHRDTYLAYTTIQVANRLRDKKPNVRLAAATQLLAVFWSSCTRRTDEASVSSGTYLIARVHVWQWQQH